MASAKKAPKKNAPPKKPGKPAKPAAPKSSGPAAPKASRSLEAEKVKQLTRIADALEQGNANQEAIRGNIKHMLTKAEISMDAVSRPAASAREETAKPAKSPKAAKAAAPEVPVSPVEPVTMESARQALMDFAAAKGKENAFAVIQQFGATKLGEVAEADLPGLVAEIKARS